MREGQSGSQPEQSRGTLLRKMGRLAGKAALGVTLALGGAEVGYQARMAEMVQPEKEHTERDAKELAGKLEAMVDFVDEFNGHHDIFYQADDEQKDRNKLKDYAVAFAQALGMTPDFQIDPSVHPTWQKSGKSDEIYELINQVLSRSGWNDKLDGANGKKMVEALRRQAQELRGAQLK